MTKKITIPANGPGTHKEMAKRVKAEFIKHGQGHINLYALERNILAIIKDYDIADAMRSFEGKEK